MRSLATTSTGAPALVPIGAGAIVVQGARGGSLGRGRALAAILRRHPAAVAGSRPPEGACS